VELNVRRYCVEKLAKSIPISTTVTKSGAAGLLFGTADPSSLVIQDVTFVSAGETESVFGPGAALDSAISNSAASETDHPESSWLDLVGWFVYHSPDHGDLTAAEIDFHLRHCGIRGVAAIVRRTTAEQLSLTFLSGTPNTQFSAATQLRASATASVDGAQPVRVRLVPPVTDEAYALSCDLSKTLDEQERMEERWQSVRLLLQRKNVLIFSAVIVIGLIAAAAFVVPNFTPHSEPSVAQRAEHGQLNMQCESLGDALMRTWNRVSPLVTSSRGGVLHVGRWRRSAGHSPEPATDAEWDVSV
jgi:hypothetical protein